MLVSGIDLVDGTPVLGECVMDGTPVCGSFVVSAV
jgi:hypothetical protein